LFLTVKSWDLGYAKQMATCGRDGYHSVFGAKISNQDVDAVALPGGGSALKFKLQPGVPFSDPALFNNPDSYPLACIVGYRGNQEGFAQGGRLALQPIWVRIKFAFQESDPFVGGTAVLELSLWIVVVAVPNAKPPRISEGFKKRSRRVRNRFSSFE
jgi:hypothetical protein